MGEFIDYAIDLILFFSAIYLLFTHPWIGIVIIVAVLVLKSGRTTTA